MTERLGDAPIQTKCREQMNNLAGALDQILNGDAKGVTSPHTSPLGAPDHG